MSHRWSNKEDVLKDLEVATGCQITDVDDGYFLYGEQPPPPLAVDNEDDEIEMRFGRAISQEPGQQDMPGPDLIGITRMLQMVQKCDNSSDDELPVMQNKKIVIKKPNTIKLPSPDKMRVNFNQGTNILPNNIVAAGRVHLNEAEPRRRESGDKIVPITGLQASKEASLSKPNEGAGDEYSPNNELTSSNFNPLASFANKKVNTNNGIVNSKLNPCVKEFIPKCAQVTSSQSFKNEKENMNIIQMISQNNDTTVTKFKQEVDKSEIAKDVTVVKNDDSSKEIKNQMAKMLKNKISTKNSTFEEQEQTNRAIVNLLKLYADPKPAKPLILLTPQFFENSKADRSTEQKAEHADKTTNVTPFEKRDAELKNNCEALPRNALNENYDLTIKEDTCDKENDSETDNTDPYIKESIRKVTNWLSEKPVVTVSEKSKSPMLHLGAVKYKRKDPVTCQSPSTVTEKKVPKAGEYRPSSYAAELHKKYSKNNSNEKPTPTLNIWEKLEADLKKRDLEVKIRKNKG